MRGMGMGAGMAPARRRRGGRFTPLSLFSAGEQGYWLDSSDFSTMFQDTAGTTPVTAVGQSVRLMLDKSRGLVPGPELVTNGNFSGGATGWTLGAWVISSGQASATETSTSLYGGQFTPVAGRVYRVEFDIISYASGALSVTVGGNFTTNANLTGAAAAPGRKSVFVTAGSIPARAVEFYGGSVTATIDNISVREVPGNHFTQTSTSNAPILGRNPVVGTRNLSTYSQDFSNVLWNADGTTKASGVAGAPDGTASVGTFTFAGAGNYFPRNTGINLVSGQTYTISAWVAVTGSVSAVFAYYNGTAWVLSSTLAATSSLQRFSWTVTAAGTPSQGTGFRFSYSGSGGTVSVWGFQVELGSTATAYQRVGSAFDVTESGVADAYYLAYDGTDDWLQSGTITPGTDKVQVFAGVRKLSDAARGMVVESGSGGTTNAILLNAPTGSLSGYGFGSFGSLIPVQAATTSPAAPSTNVLTGIGDIVADTAVLRINGTQAASSTADQGTGNYLAYPHYIGRRGGTSLPFNGRIYQLICRFGSNLTAAQIQQVETFVNQRTGAY